jgi:hypothetical protein
LVANTTMTAANSAHNAETTLNLAAISPPVVRAARRRRGPTLEGSVAGGARPYDAE